MANLNKVMLIGRLTRDPEVRMFANGGKVAKFGFAVNNRKKNMQTGQWEEEPVFIDCDAFNRETGRKLADLVEQYLAKGRQVFLEGHLKFEQWTSQDGQKKSALRVVVDNLEFLDSKQEGGTTGGTQRSYSGAQQRSAPPAAPPSGGDYDAPPSHDPGMDAPPPGPSEGGDIPF